MRVAVSRPFYIARFLIEIGDLAIFFCPFAGAHAGGHSLFIRLVKIAARFLRKIVPKRVVRCSSWTWFLMVWFSRLTMQSKEILWLTRSIWAMMENLSGNLIVRSATLLQHVLNSMKPNGKAAIVLPTGFLTAKSSVEGKLLKNIVLKHIVNERLAKKKWARYN